MHFAEALHTLRAKAAAVAVAAVSQSKKKKKLAGEVIATKIISIEGMHCENCKNTVRKVYQSDYGCIGTGEFKKRILRLCS